VTIHPQSTFFERKLIFEATDAIRFMGGQLELARNYQFISDIRGFRATCQLIEKRQFSSLRGPIIMCFLALGARLWN